MVFAKKSLEKILITHKKITLKNLEEAKRIQKETGQDLEEILIKEGHISEKAYAEARAEQYNAKYIDLNNYDLDPKLVMSFSYRLLYQHKVIPIKKENNILTLAMTDVFNVVAREDIQKIIKIPITPVIAEESIILNLLNRYFGIEEAIVDANDIKEEAEDTDIEGSPVVKVIDSIIQQAVSKGASDIHIEPQESSLYVRIRIDGVLHDLTSFSLKAHPVLTSRIKIMANMDISERRLPQDGRIVFNKGYDEINLRISTIPTVTGEKTVIRILDRSKIIIPIDKLGFSSHNNKRFSLIIKAAQGMLLVVGPTGCGKTTTLYSVLNHLNTVEKNIITVEDPVEYHLNRINQIQVNPKIGFDFGSVLRTVLRQDPDIIMIGEIRDRETAEITIKAALTGHLVLSTLHSNNAVSVITRLIDMGIDNFLIASAIKGVVSQRLVRKICVYCKTEHEPSPDEKVFYKKTMMTDISAPLFEGKGCEKCNFTGYSGRLAIHEVFVMNKKMKEIILESPSESNIFNQAKEDGLKTLQEEGIRTAI